MTANARRIPLLDLTAQHAAIREEVMAAAACVIESQRFILGEDVARLEAAVAQYCGARFAVGCASGSDALYLAMLALDIGPGDEVLTAPYTFFATAGEIARLGARPVFADIDPGTFNIDPRKVVEALDRHPRIKAIIPVHLFGACADMDPILEAARERGIAVIEDAAQAIGAEYKGRRAGSMGDAGCFSFFPSKNLGGWGDGGMVTTSREDLAEKIRALRVHGARRKYCHDWVGVNSRLDTLQAAVLLVKMKRLDVWTAGRERHARMYRDMIAARGVPVRTPSVPDYCTRHVWNQFVIRCEKRDEARALLEERGVGTEIYYPVPLHLQKCFEYLGYREGDFPASEECARQALALPVYAELADSDLEYVVDCLAAMGTSG